MNINGIIPALVTPFDSNGKVDYGALKELVNYLIEKGAAGFYACGSTAECFLLTEEERKQVLETVIRTTDGKIPVVAHIGDIGTAKTIELAKHAQASGATAVSSVPPFYYKFSFDEIAGYYADIASAVDLPMIVYSIPAFSGVEITADNLKTILDASGAKGLKYTAYNQFELEKIRRRYPDLKIFNGHDEVFLNALPIGIDGAIGSTFNVMTPKFLKLKALYNSGNMVAASELQGEINYIIEVFIQAGVNQSIKYLLTKEGISCNDCRKPFAKITPLLAEKLDAIYPIVFDKHH